MKNILIIFGAILIVATILISCGGKVNDEEKSSDDATTTITDADTLKENLSIEAQPEEIEPADVSLSLYINPWEADIFECEEFRTNKKCIFCYDTQSFHSLWLWGEAKQLTLIVKADNKVVYKKENFDLDSVMEFYSDSFDFSMSYNYYSIILKQGEKNIFTGKIEVTGCS